MCRVNNVHTKLYKLFIRRYVFDTYSIKKIWALYSEHRESAGPSLILQTLSV